MKGVSKADKHFNKLFMVAVICLAFFISFVIVLFFNCEDASNTYAANSVSFSLQGTKAYDSNRANGDGVNPDSIPYDGTGFPNTSNHIVATFASNNLHVESVSNYHFEALYADISSNISVPAWYEYKIDFKFEVEFRKTNAAAANAAGFEVYDFAGDDANGDSAEFTFKTSSDVSTSPAQYTKLSAYYNQDATTHNETYTISYTYTNASNQVKTYTNNFGAFTFVRATTTNATRIYFDMGVSAQVTEKKLSITKPTADTRTFVYNGNPQTFQPVNYDTTKMTLATDSDSLTQTNVDTYTIKIVPDATAVGNPAVKPPWDDGTYDTVELSFVILKANPTVNPQYTVSNPMYLSPALPDISIRDGDTPGTISWDANQVPSVSVSEYKWTFTPDDMSNYNIKTGTEKITYIDALPVGLQVEVKPNTDIYDRYDTLMYPTLSDYLKSCISVKVVYQDGTVSQAPLPNSDFTVTNTNISVSSGESEIKNIDVRITSKDDTQLFGMTGSVNATVNKAVIQQMSVYPADNAIELKYPVTLEQIKANYDVYIQWNFANRSLKADEQLVSVAVKASADNPDAKIKAGIIDLTFTYNNNGLTESSDLIEECVIAKGDVNMDGVSFADNTFSADGSSHTLMVDGVLPDGVTVSYSVAGQSDISFTAAGTYVFTAHFSNPDPTNYNDIADMTATLTIEYDPNVTPPEIENPPKNPSNNGPTFLDKIKAFFNNLIEKHFPLWQVITMAVSALLALIFMIKAIQYGNRAKKAKGEAKKIKAKAYAAFLPIFSTEVVALGLSNQIWSIMAFAFVGLALLMFVIALITRHSWKKAERAKETVISAEGYAPQSANMLIAESNNALDEMRRELKETLSQVRNNTNMDSDRDTFEKHLYELEERHRKEMEMLREEQRRENERREEEQAKRDEAMKLMLANMLGRQQGEEGFAYASLDDTDMLVQRVIAGLLPAVQQMIPEPTAYLSAPAYEQSESNIEAIADRVAEKLSGQQPVYDNSSEMKAMADEVSALREQVAILSQNQYDAVILDEEEDDFDDEEEWDSVLDEDDDDFIEAVVIDDDGTVRKASPNFRMRLKQSSDKNREWYAAIKNLFCSQKNITYRVYKRVEKIRYQGNVIAVIGIAKRSIKLWLALKPFEYDARRYHHKDVSDKPRFVDVPLYVRVGSDRALTRAQELILALFQEQATEPRKRYTDRDIQELIFTLKYNKLLTKQNKGLLREVMHVHDCDVLDNEIAEKCIESKNVEYIDDSVIEAVKLDDIDMHFQDGNRVTVEKLRKLGLVSAECTGYNVVAGQRLTKPLIIVANDFTMEAVKMIALTGGRVIKLTQVVKQK